MKAFVLKEPGVAGWHEAPEPVADAITGQSCVR